MSDPKDLRDLKDLKELKGIDSMSSFTLPGPESLAGSLPQNMGLADLARGLQYVVNEAAMAAHLHMQKTLDQYFDAEGNPRCRRVNLPGGAGSVDVPVIALTPPANLMLEQMEVALAVRVTNLRAVSDAKAAPSVPKSEADGDEDEKVDGATRPHIFSTPEAADAHGRPEAAASHAAAAGAEAPTPRPRRAVSFAVPPPEPEPARSRDRRSLDRLSFEIQPAPVSPDSAARREANVMDIKMTFRRNESPEGVARLVALYTDSMFRITTAAK